MGLDRARGSSMQPGRELNPFAHRPTRSPSTSPWLSAPSPFAWNTNENTNRPSVISLFMIPTVISGHGNGILLHDQGSPDTPLTPLLKINTHQLFALPLSSLALSFALSSHCFAWRNLNVFDKGKRRGNYFHAFARKLRFHGRPIGVSVGPSSGWRPSTTFGFHRHPLKHFRMCLFCHEGISKLVQTPPLTRERYPPPHTHTQAEEAVHVRTVCTINQWRR